MTRKQLYSEIVSLGLQEEIKSRYGRNYTQCSSENLQKVIDEVYTDLDIVSEVDLPKNDTKVVTKSHDSEINAVYLVHKLVDILAKKKILLKSEVNQFN